ncbi:MAG: alpha-galactosidase [Candidatus Aminicenantes bacterium]|nr:alpha-galactosidase [Candidatus Aminicenantes bacterium]
MKRVFLYLLILSLITGFVFAASKSFSLENQRVRLTIIIKNGHIEKEILESKSSLPASVITDGDFSLNVMWTGWRAPGKVNNSENPVIFNKENFIFQEAKEKIAGKEKELSLIFSGNNRVPFHLILTYKLGNEDFFVRRKISVFDNKTGLHFLRKIYVYKASILNPYKVVKKGGYGQPVALKMNSGGAFWGLEYPAGTNLLKDKRIISFQYIGEKITSEGVSSDWAVFAVTPDSRVKYWFFKYLDKIRIASLRPYLLYNSWYDLRAPEMVKSPRYIMNEKNVRRIINLFNRNLTRKYGIKLDAFVLDDGWDIYRSDWQLSREQFPQGLKPISDMLGKTNTSLGIWFGPIGGYSHRNWRVEWMKEHGYETVGDQMCFGGRKYSQLFKNRVLEFVKKYNVGYYKWDGFQFSCSEPAHGHPAGIYSRRAILKKLIQVCQEVRSAKPDIFLNITSGTWLSPWWLLYADTIWMQGYDYGYSDVPSISKRDRAMTYRDYVLYDDLKRKDFWFPISNLMTHGIIKGHLQKLGGENEPIDKFTNNAVLYFARGISMYELYVSPDILIDAEWDAIAKSYKWAKDRFLILTANTEMIGGDPGKGEAYGYVHFKGEEGIIALRNPVMKPQSVKFKLDPGHGFSSIAEKLVLERVYPSRKFSKQLFTSGQVIEIPLQGYETAVYEIYPLKKANIPVIGGAEFSVENVKGNVIEIGIYRSEGKPVILNPELVSSVKFNLRVIEPDRIPEFKIALEKVKTKVSHKADGMELKIKVPPRIKNAILAVLVRAEGEKKKLEVPEFYAGKMKLEPEVEMQKNSWAWYKIKLRSGTQKIYIKSRGKMEGWIIYRQRFYPRRLIIETTRPVKIRPLPPLPWKPGTIVSKDRIF